MNKERCFARSITYPELSDWIKAEGDSRAWHLQPIHTGSIYIKPTEDKQSCCSKCFSYFYYIFCCIYIRSE